MRFSSVIFEIAPLQAVLSLSVVVVVVVCARTSVLMVFGVMVFGCLLCNGLNGETTHERVHYSYYKWSVCVTTIILIMESGSPNLCFTLFFSTRSVTESKSMKPGWECTDRWKLLSCKVQALLDEAFSSDLNKLALYFRFCDVRSQRYLCRCQYLRKGEDGGQTNYW